MVHSASTGEDLGAARDPSSYAHLEAVCTTQFVWRARRAGIYNAASHAHFCPKTHKTFEFAIAARFVPIPPAPLLRRRRLPLAFSGEGRLNPVLLGRLTVIVVAQSVCQWDRATARVRAPVVLQYRSTCGVPNAVHRPVAHNQPMPLPIALWGLNLGVTAMRSPATPTKLKVLLQAVQLWPSC